MKAFVVALSLLAVAHGSPTYTAPVAGAPVAVSSFPYAPFLQPAALAYANTPLTLPTVTYAHASQVTVNPYDYAGQVYPLAEPYIHEEVPAQPYNHEEVPAEPYVHEEVPSEPYVHEEVPAEPYVHEEIPAEPYIHQEPVDVAVAPVVPVAPAAPAAPVAVVAGPVATYGYAAPVTSYTYSAPAPVASTPLAVNYGYAAAAAPYAFNYGYVPAFGIAHA